MRKIAKLLTVILSVLIVSSSVFVSACDLSCWLNQASSDCHSASPTEEDRMASSAAMDMSAGIDMRSHSTQSQTPPYERAKGITGHVMSAQMAMSESAPQVVTKTEGSTSTAFAHSKALPACSQETCSQAAASSSPPKTSQGRSPGPRCGVIRVSTPANVLTSSNRIHPGAPPPTYHPADLLSPLRI